jgi:hypothetical protein
MKGFRSHHPPSLNFSWRNVRKPAHKATLARPFDRLTPEPLRPF